jgi:hypothetical protein
MVEYNLNWLKGRGFFKRAIPLKIKGKEVQVDDENLLAYVEVSSPDEVEELKKEMSAEMSAQKVRYIWFFFPDVGKLRVFRKIGGVKWFYYSSKMRSDYLKSRVDKLNKFSPENMNILFDIRDIVEKFYWQLWEMRIVMARSVVDLKEDRNKLLVVQYLIDRLIFFYFLSQLKLVRIKNEEREWILDKRNTREFFKWICSMLNDEEDLQEFLNKIFFEVLGQADESGWGSLEFNIKGERFFVNAPSLNGGLFVEHEIEGIKERKIKIKGIKKLILEVLNKYNWIIGEELPEEEDVVGDLTPEVIGHIYEKFVVSLEQIGLEKIKLKDIQAVKEELIYGRRKIGAYYTPEEITNYVARNTIYPCIRDKLKEKFGKQGVKLLRDLFERDTFSDELGMIKSLYFEILTQIKICDNACGSGSFLIAAGEVLLRLYSRVLNILQDKLPTDKDVQKVLSELNSSPSRNYYIVRQIIVNNLYGVDLMEGAVEIAKLRFWLWLISQVDVKKAESRKIEILPNLDFNLMVGNSLIGYTDIEDVEFDFAPVEPKLRWKTLQDKQCLLTTWTDSDKVKWLQTLMNEKRRFKTLPAHEAIKLKEKLSAELSRAREFLNKKFYNLLKSKGINVSWEEFLKLKPFHWGFEFYEVFDLEKPIEERGFDIIIGNPPYGNIFVGEELKIVQMMFPFASSSKDSSAVFIERSSEMLNKKGKFGMIVPLNIARIERFHDIRKFLVENVHTYMILDCGNPFAGQVELEMIVIFYDFKQRNSLVVRSLKPVPINAKGIPYSFIRKYQYRFILYLDEIYETIIKGSKFGWLEVSQGVPRRADYKKNGQYLCLSAICLDRYTIKLDKIQWERKVTEKFVRENKLENQLEEAIITPFSLGKTGKVTDLAFECVIKPKNYLPDGTTIFIRLKDNKIDKKYALVILNSSLINYITCRYILSYGVRIFRNYLFYMLPLRVASSQRPFIILADYMLFLNATKERRTKEQELIEFIDKQIIDSLVYELYFKEKFEQDGIKTNLLELVEFYLKDISKLNLDRQKLETIKNVFEKIKNDKKIMEQIEKIKSHPWVKTIETAL